MDEPNLQTVPKPHAYKVLLSASDAARPSDQASAHAMRTANLRAAFVAPPGFLLLSGGHGARGGGEGGRRGRRMAHQGAVTRCQAAPQPPGAVAPPLLPSARLCSRLSAD